MLYFRLCLVTLRYEANANDSFSTKYVGNTYSIPLDNFSFSTNLIKRGG